MPVFLFVLLFLAGLTIILVSSAFGFVVAIIGAVVTGVGFAGMVGIK